MRRIRYAVATSLDGYIAGPNGEADWIIMDPEIAFGARSPSSTPSSLDAGPSKI